VAGASRVLRSKVVVHAGAYLDLVVAEKLRAGEGVLGAERVEGFREAG
jgi:hypothetical protein